MRRQLIFRICLLVLCCLLFRPLQTSAAPLEPDRECSLTLSYAMDGQGFSGVEIRIYRVAQAFPDGSYQLMAPFASYPVNIYGITSQKEWKDTATTLTAYIAANQDQPYRTAETNESGAAAFTGLETGLYLVSGAVVENDSGTYIFDDFMVYLPTPQEDGTFAYDVEAKPKCASFVPKTEYKILKLWKDAGNSGARPKSVTIDILKDGVLQETVLLSTENNWSYTWKVSADDRGKWSVVEQNVPDSYKVTVSESAGTFTVTNTREADPGTPPKTGDSFAFWPWVMSFCLSGSLLVLLGFYQKRKHP